MTVINTSTRSIWLCTLQNPFQWMNLKCLKRGLGNRQRWSYGCGLCLQACSGQVFLLFLEVLTAVSAPGQVIISPFYQLFHRLVISGEVFHPCRSAMWKETHFLEKNQIITAFNQVILILYIAFYDAADKVFKTNDSFINRLNLFLNGRGHWLCVVWASNNADI